MRSRRSRVQIKQRTGCRQPVGVRVERQKGERRSVCKVKFRGRLSAATLESWKSLHKEPTDC